MSTQPDPPQQQSAAVVSAENMELSLFYGGIWRSEKCTDLCAELEMVKGIGSIVIGFKKCVGTFPLTFNVSDVVAALKHLRLFSDLFLYMFSLKLHK